MVKMGEAQEAMLTQMVPGPSVDSHPRPLTRTLSPQEGELRKLKGLMARPQGSSASPGKHEASPPPARYKHAAEVTPI